MNKRIQFMAAVVISGIVTIAGNFVLLMLFRAGDVPFQVMLIRAGLPLLGYFVASSAVLSLSAPLFSSPAIHAEGGEFVKFLEKFGIVPLKTIAFIVVLQAVFLIVIFLQGSAAGIEREIRTPLFMAALSAGMLVGTFMYVLSDNMISKTLIANNLTHYPRELREQRQSVKMMIIPLAVALLTLLFAISVTILTAAKAGVDFSVMTGGAWFLTIVFMAAFIVFVFILTLVIKSNTAALYTSVIDQLENLSSEKKDLTRRITICSVDELGTIAGMVNSFCENMAGGMRDIKDGQEVLSASGERLGANAAGMASAIKEISQNVASVREQTQSQIRTVAESSASVHQIAKNIESLNTSIDTQASSMSQASAAVEEMIGNINSIGGVAEKMAQQFNTVNTAASEGSRIQQESGDKIQKIVTQSEMLREANRIIATIAAQTNLLAMNAAIEAAHAGDAGKGFSVVADEIRKLAENSSGESQKISVELKQITETIDGIVKGAEASARAFAQVSERVEETERLVLQVNNAVQEQQEGADQVLSALKAMNEITGQVKAGSREMNAGNEDMLREISALQDQARDISSNVDTISAEIRTINAGAQEVSELAESTQSTIQKVAVVVNLIEV
ncbi:MAG: methyl-accepting chemotaxis protein [Treponema sp.]|jgi:methyl-accepting chemotaxis protein|nr:methyl-accepting chemotaxis protein [Treponema sp.]